MTEQVEPMTGGERTDLLFGASNWDLGQEGEILSSDFDDDLFGESTFTVAGLGNPFNVRQSPDPFNPDSLDDKQVIQAAAAAAGLSRGGMRRAAFSMNDMTALVPSNSSSPAPAARRKGGGSPVLPKVSEGEELHQASSSRPAQGMGGGMGISSGGGAIPMEGGAGGKADRLNGMSINELEEELVRSRNQMASYQVPITSPEVGGNRMGGGGGGLLAGDGSDMYGSNGLEDGASWNDTGSIGSGAVRGTGVSAGGTVPRGGFRSPGGGSGGSGFMGGMDDSGATDSPMPSSKARMRRAQSTGDLAGMSAPTSTGGSGGSMSPQRGVGDRLDLEFSVGGDSAGATSGSSSVYRIGKYTLEERRNKILRYRQKRHERNFNKKIKYACRKTLADSRPRIRGRFAKNEEWDAMKREAALREEQGIKSEDEGDDGAGGTGIQLGGAMVM